MTFDMEIIKGIGQLAGAVMTIIALATLVIRPLRNKFNMWIKTISGIDGQNKALADIEGKVDILGEKIEIVEERLADNNQANIITIGNRITKLYYDYIDKPSMPDFEKKNLIKHYEIYDSLGGNSYIASCVKELCIKFNIEIKRQKDCRK